MSSSLFNAGCAVRLIHNPSRIGTLTGKTRERAGKVLYQVRFDDGPSFQQSYALELVNEGADDPYELLDQGRFGRLPDLRRNLTHIQLSGRLANLVYSMDVTNTEFYPYQYKPVLSFLESPSNGILIADEVGLGKTIEAGLIWTELRSRTDARRLLVICPAMLREKWRDELRDRFGVDAEIMNPKELMSELKRGKHQVADGKGIVCSMQGLRPGRGWKKEENKSSAAKLARFLDEMSDEEPLFDLVIIDEAHYMRNPESQTAKLGKLVRDVTENIVLLSATPVNLKSDDLFHLLKLVDPDSFEHSWQFPEVLQANEPLNRARDLVLKSNSEWGEVKEILLKAQQHSLLENSRQLEKLQTFEPEEGTQLTGSERVLLADRISKVNMLRHAVTRTRKSEVHEWQVTRIPKTLFVELTELERNFYEAVTLEIRKYAISRELSDGFLLATPQRQISSCMYAAVKAWQKRINPEEVIEFSFETFGDTEFGGVQLESFTLPSELTNSLTANIIKKLASQIDLKQLRDHDSKYFEFRKIIREYLAQHENEKVVVFSFFRETLKYLSERLTEDGITSQVLMGGMAESKQELIHRFREANDVQVLLSSEVASEGVDLQFCKILVNYDLPWNPMRVEQRIGRIDRLGQKSPRITIINLCYEDTIDQRIYIRLFQRLKIFEQALGGLDGILGEKISGLTSDLFSNELTPEQENERIERVALAVERRQQESNELENNASTLVAHGDYILRSVKAAHEFKHRITKRDLVIYVKDYLNKFAQGHTFYEVDPEALVFEIQLPGKMCAELDAFCRERNLLDQTKLATRDKRRCEFLNKVKRNAGTVEVINQFHPLIRFIGYDLRLRDEAFYPLIAVKLNTNDTGDIAAGVYAFVARKWEFSGVRVEEELVSSAIDAQNKSLLSLEQSLRLINDARLYGSDWLEIQNDLTDERSKQLLDLCEEVLDNSYEEAVSIRENENLDRINLQIKSADNHFKRQLESLNRVLENYRFSGNSKMIPATQGRVNRLNEKYEVTQQKLTQHKRLSHSQSEVCIGLIKVV